MVWCVCVLDNNNKILIGERSKPSLWSLDEKLCVVVHDRICDVYIYLYICLAYLHILESKWKILRT